MKATHIKTRFATRRYNKTDRNKRNLQLQCIIRTTLLWTITMKLRQYEYRLRQLPSGANPTTTQSPVDVSHFKEKGTTTNFKTYLLLDSTTPTFNQCYYKTNKNTRSQVPPSRKTPMPRYHVPSQSKQQSLPESKHRPRRRKNKQRTARKQRKLCEYQQKWHQSRLRYYQNGEATQIITWPSRRPHIRYYATANKLASASTSHGRRITTIVNTLLQILQNSCYRKDKLSTPRKFQHLNNWYENHTPRRRLAATKQMTPPQTKHRMRQSPANLLHVRTTNLIWM